MTQMISVAAFCRLSTCGRTKAYELINQGRIKSVRVDGRRLIHLDSVVALLEHGTQDDQHSPDA